MENELVDLPDPPGDLVVGPYLIIDVSYDPAYSDNTIKIVKEDGQLVEIELDGLFEKES